MRTDERVIALQVLHRHIEEALQHVRVVEEQRGRPSRYDLEHLCGHTPYLLLWPLHQLNDCLEVRLNDVCGVYLRAVVAQDAQRTETRICVGPLAERQLMHRELTESVVGIVLDQTADLHRELLTSVRHCEDLIVDRVWQVVPIVN